MCRLTLIFNPGIISYTVNNTTYTKNTVLEFKKGTSVQWHIAWSHQYTDLKTNNPLPPSFVINKDEILSHTATYDPEGIDVRFYGEPNIIESWTAQGYLSGLDYDYAIDGTQNSMPVFRMRRNDVLYCNYKACDHLLSCDLAYHTYVRDNDHQQLLEGTSLSISLSDFAQWHYLNIDFGVLNYTYPSMSSWFMQQFFPDLFK